MKVLNLYSGIGGNRKLWENVEVTAVELNPDIAKIYQDFFPNDKMIIGDAHEYLLEHFSEYDFIWSSPPCPSHSRARFWGSHRADTNIIYPDMKLWQEIILLQNFVKGFWVVENVQPYYGDPFNGKHIWRHYLWSNFTIANILIDKKFNKDSVDALQKLHGFDLSSYKTQKQKVLRNAVLPELGLHILNCAIGNIHPIPMGNLFENYEQMKGI